MTEIPDLLEGRPDKLPDDTWGAWVEGSEGEIVEGALVRIVTEGRKQWTAPIVEVIARWQETGESLCKMGRGTESEPADPEAWARRMERARRARKLLRRAKRGRWPWWARVAVLLLWALLIFLWCS